jgi:hypothetical protein
MTDSCPFDKLGQPVFVGSIIAYGHALGRCAALRIGRVLELGRSKPPMWTPNAEPGWKATVIGIDDDWPSGRPVALNTKTGTLFFPERWIVLSDEQVPAAYRDLLAGFQWPRPASFTRKRRASTIGS